MSALRLGSVTKSDYPQAYPNGPDPATIAAQLDLATARIPRA
jgi:hypothetical protein